MNAKEIYYIILAAFATVGATISQYMGGWDHLSALLAWLMAVDYLTGALCAAVWHKSPKTETGGYESRTGFKGLIRKGTIILVVMIAAELDKLTNTSAMRTATILFFAANDGMSILENLGIMGVPFPPALKNAFEVLRKKGQTDDEEKTHENTIETYQSQHNVKTEIEKVAEQNRHKDSE